MFTDELLAYLFDGQPHFLAEPMAGWLTTSRGFTTFVDTFRDKIRKKIRTTQDQETLLDLRLELETAYLLLQEQRLSLMYEPQLAGKSRGPDFSVSFTTSLTFMVEVTRLRTEQKSPSTETNGLPSNTLVGEHLADTVCSKLSQLLPQQSNILLIGVDVLRLTSDDVRAALLRMQQRAERNESTFLQRYQFRDRTDFFRHFQRLSEVLVRGSTLQSAEPLVVWVNPQAKHPLPSKVRTVLYRSHAV